MLLAGSNQSLPICQRSFGSKLARSLPANPRRHRVPFSALGVMHIPVGPTSSIDIGCERVTVILHVSDQRLHISHSFAEVCESRGELVQLNTIETARATRKKNRP